MRMASVNAGPSTLEFSGMPAQERGGGRSPWDGPMAFTKTNGLTARTPRPKCTHVHTPTCNPTALIVTVMVAFAMTATAMITLHQQHQGNLR